MVFKTTNFKGQKYSSLKREYAKKGELFVDPVFPPNNKSLFYSKVDKDVVWKRPKARICKEITWARETNLSDSDCITPEGADLFIEKILYTF